MNIEPLLHYFSKFLPLEEQEIAFLESVFKERKVRRRHFILQERDVCKYNSFAVEGCFRMYKVGEN